ncbi:hypothetical protein ACP70R_026996 [Stipagrostis hirtigluma subsp. patula]
MGSVLSSACAALRAFMDAQLDKVEARQLMAIFPHLRDLPAEDRDRQLRWLMGMGGHHPPPEAASARSPFEVMVWSMPTLSSGEKAPNG